MKNKPTEKYSKLPTVSEPETWRLVVRPVTCDPPAAVVNIKGEADPAMLQGLEWVTPMAETPEEGRAALRRWLKLSIIDDLHDMLGDFKVVNKNGQGPKRKLRDIIDFLYEQRCEQVGIGVKG